MGGKLSRSRKKKSSKNPVSVCLTFPSKNHHSEIWSTFKLLDLPEKVQEKIWSYLDFPSKRVLRQVSHKLKQDIEMTTGHHVVITNASAEFSRTIKVSCATIVKFGLNITTNNSHKDKDTNKAFFMFPEALESVVVVCPVSILLIKTVFLPSYEHITFISFRGTCLTAGNFLFEEGSKLSNVPNCYGSECTAFDIDVEIEANTADQNQNKPLRLLQFSSLRTLLIEYDVNYSDIDQLQNLHDNMTFILKKFGCKKLETFHVEPLTVPDPESNKLSYIHMNTNELFEGWENELLKIFVHRHSSTLKNICIFFHEYNPVGENYDINYECPTNLTHYTIRCMMLNPGPSPTQNLYWKRILLQQQKLESCVIRAELWHDLAGAIKALESVIQQNGETLQDICVGSMWHDSQTCATFDFRVDFSVFHSALALRSLDLFASVEFQQKLDLSVSFVGHSLMHIPPNLRNLKITGIALRSDEISALEFHPRLKQVTLIDVGKTGILGVNYQVLMCLLRNKSIQQYIFSGFNLNANPGLLESYIRKRNHGKFSTDIIICKRGAEFVDENVEDNIVTLIHDRQKETQKCFPWT